MADSKKYNGSTWEHSLRKLTTATDTITTLPSDLYADGTNATVGLVGNMQQSGAPTPQSPIQPSETGERTGNLFDGNYVNAYLTSTGIYIYPDTTTKSIIVKCDPNTTYTIKQITYTGTRHKWRIAVFDGVPTNNAQGTLLVNDDSLSESTITTLNDSAYIVVYYMYPTPLNDAKFMINLGSTPLPYEPYGYKIPISSAATTTPVYLGEVESTRRIKKLVLTGNENWQRASNGAYYVSNLITDELKIMSLTTMCSHYESQNNVTGTSSVADNKMALYGDSASSTSWVHEIYIAARDISTKDDFKAYLATQYANGTPVTVWYVLATETTGIVNEPIRKIGDYADTVSGITIPTVTGADSFDVLTTLKPSEVELTYTGWHDAEVEEWDGSQWQ